VADEFDRLRAGRAWRNPFSHALHGDGARADWCPLHGGTAAPERCRGWRDGFPCPGDPGMPSDRIGRATWLHLVLTHRTRLENPGADGGAEFVRWHTALLAAAEGE
jgi:hypothetical protein